MDDEPSIVNLIRMNLKLEGYDTVCAYTGREAVEAYAAQRPDIVLLDIMLPDMDGYDVLRAIQELDRSAAVIFITANDKRTSKILGLELGADDYITKPFEIAELLARVETVLRRYHKTESRITVGDVVVDTQSRVVTRGGEPVQLTAKEYNLLILFLQNKNIALFRETIYERVWENDYMGDSRTVDLHVQRLRKKLGWQERIAAVYKVGYRLEVKE